MTLLALFAHYSKYRFCISFSSQNPEKFSKIRQKAPSPSSQTLQYKAVIQLHVPKECAGVVFRIHLLFGRSNVQHEENKLPHYFLLSGEELQDLLDCVLLSVLLR